MTTYLIMRHGEAEPQSASDAERNLTAYGKAYTRQIASQIADFLQQKEIRLGYVLHSPYLRARQTAEIVREVLGYPVGTEVLEEATPDDDPQQCLRKLDGFSGESFILVSHMPIVASLSSLLEHGNVYGGHGYHTSEVRLFDADIWGQGCGTMIARFY